jgi:hypothetical protein
MRSILASMLVAGTCTACTTEVLVVRSDAPAAKVEATPASPVAIARHSRPMTFVDLDKPGMLDRIEQENPEHYAQILRMLDRVYTLDCDGAARLFRTGGERGHFTCESAMVMTSLPPKKRVSLVVDDKVYSGHVALSVRLPHAAP